MKKYNCLIIGAGNKGALADCKGSGNEHKFLSYAHAIKEHYGFNLLGFMDIDYINAIKAGNLWDTKAYEMSYDIYDQIDVIIIATPDKQHVCGLDKALDYNPKLVICEKPIFTNVEQGMAALKEYKYKKVPILVNYTRRFIPKWQQLKTDIAMGKYGKLINGYLYFNGGKLHTASHFIDLLLYLGLDWKKIDFKEVDVNFKWVFSWGLIFENDIVTEFITKDQINSIYNQNSMQLMENSYKYLKFGESLICTGNEALESLLLTNKIFRDKI